MIRTTALMTIAWLSLAGAPLLGEQFEVQPEEGGVTIKRQGELLARYVTKSGNKPILWPIIGPFGNEITRQYPMRDAAPDERADHPHHRSFWFTHGDVNGISFWHEGQRTGEIVHKEFLETGGGEHAVVKTRNDWIGPEGNRICQDVRSLTFGTAGDSVWIDFDCTVTATDGPVTFGDTKEGSFGVRVAGSMKVDSKPGGEIVNSEGQTDRGAWGQRAAWCDYHGPVKGKTVGIAIMTHPDSLRFPAYWHVRTYGLFTANMWGVGDFTKAPKGTGDYVLPAGESFDLHFRVLIHPGDEKEGQVARAYEEYAELKK
jgi:hypothetical protein